MYPLMIIFQLSFQHPNPSKKDNFRKPYHIVGKDCIGAICNGHINAVHFVYDIKKEIILEQDRFVRYIFI